MSELIYLSSQKLHGRLGIPSVAANAEMRGGIKLPPVAPILEWSATHARTTTTEGQASRAALAKGIKKIDKLHSPQEFTTKGLTPNQWIKFDLSMAHAAVHEDSGRPPEDIALFVGEATVGSYMDGMPGIGLMLCGSVRHLLTQANPNGRMGSDTGWLYNLINELERRESEGIHVVPEFLTEIVPHKGTDREREAAAQAVFGWTSRDYPPRSRSRLRGYATVLMDIDNPRHWIRRLVVASPLYVEVPPQNPKRRFGWMGRKDSRNHRV
ncbi:SAVMC3_10250 family protein [Nonomuraea insulae]|uniref:SAVMC3_10250 family protein n=1 Tax=Nonomuraea insulae TaxID=1616787 RepID=A0ABW1CI06_9ACTN